MQFGSAAEFAEALTELRLRAGMTVRDVSRATQIPSATLGGYFSGRHLPPRTRPEVLRSVLAALAVPEEEIEDWVDALTVLRPGTGKRRGAAPYRGLESYGTEDAEWYHGREALAAEVVDLVHDRLRAPDGARLVTLIGPSGSGKSSLLRAGITPLLDLPYSLCVPEPEPVAALRSATAEIDLDGPAHVLLVDQLEEVFAAEQDPALREAFIRALVEHATPGPDRPPVVVVVALRADRYGHALSDPLLQPLLPGHQVVVAGMSADELRRVITEPAVRAGCTVEPQLVDLLLRDLSPRGLLARDRVALPLLSHALWSTWQRASGGRLTVSDYLATGGIAGAVQKTAEEVYAALDAEHRAATRRLFTRLVSLDEEGTPTRNRIALSDLDADPAALRVADDFVARRILTVDVETLEISHDVLMESWPRLADWLREDQDAVRLRRRVAAEARTWDEHDRVPEALLRGPVLGLAKAVFAGGGPHDAMLSPLERSYLAASMGDDDRREAERRRQLRRLRALLVTVAALAVVGAVLSVYLVRYIAEATEDREAALAARADALSRHVAAQAAQLLSTDPALSAQLALVSYRIAPTVHARSTLLDATARVPATRLAGPEGVIRAVAAPGGDQLATATDAGDVRIWEVPASPQAPEQVAAVDARGDGELFAAAYAPDGDTLAVGGIDGTVTLMDVSRPSEPRVLDLPLDGPISAVQSLTFSPDGTELAAATSDPALHRWRLDSGTATALAPVTGFGGSVQDVAYHPDGDLLATGSADGTVRLWQRETGRDGSLRELRRLSVGDETNFVHAVAFSADGHWLAAGAKDKRVRVWDVRRPEAPVLVDERLGGFPAWVNDVAFSPDSRWLTAVASGGLVQVWETDDWDRMRSFSGRTNFTSVDVLPGRDAVVAGSVDGFTRIFPLAGPAPEPFDGSIWGLTRPAGEDELFVGTGAPALAVQELDVTDPLRPEPAGPPLTGPDQAGPFTGVTAVSPDGSLLVAATATGNLVVWRRGTSGGWERTGVLHAAGALVENLAVSSDGRYLASAADDGVVSVYAVDTDGLPRRVARLEADGMAIAVALNGDGSMLAVGTAEQVVQLWHRDGEAYEPLRTLEGFDNYVYSAAFSPDGGLLAAGSTDRTVRLWSTADPGRIELVEVLSGPEDTIFDLDFSEASGGLLAGAGGDRSVWVWRVEEGRDPTLWARLRALEVGSYQVSPHPTEPVLSAAGAEGRLTSWLVDVEAAARLICSSSGSDVTQAEWDRYVHDGAYRPPCPG